VSYLEWRCACRRCSRTVGDGICGGGGTWRGGRGGGGGGVREEPCLALAVSIKRFSLHIFFFFSCFSNINLDPGENILAEVGTCCGLCLPHTQKST